jgi:UV DNA damage endonuclease
MTPVGRVGFAVKVLGDGGLPSHDARRWQAGPHLSVSLDRLEAILERLDAIDVRMYRMASALAPYATHPDLPQFHRQVEDCGGRLADVGAKAGRLGVRLSFHPGQYVVLNSERPEVQALAARDLNVMAALLDALGCERDAVVVLHVGGMAGGREAALDRFERGLEMLGEAARRRLVVENDDRAFSLADVLELHSRTGLAVVWDVLHHHCHDPAGIPADEALRAALATWPDAVVPKIHFSSPKTAVEERRDRAGRRVITKLVLPQLRAHADLIDPVAFEEFLRGPASGLRFDIMLEAKAKDVALMRLREQLLARGFEWGAGRLLAPRASAPQPPASVEAYTR